MPYCIFRCASFSQFRIFIIDYRAWKFQLFFWYVITKNDFLIINKNLLIFLMRIWSLYFDLHYLNKKFLNDIYVKKEKHLSISWNQNEFHIRFQDLHFFLILHPLHKQLQDIFHKNIYLRRFRFNKSLILAEGKSLLCSWFVCCSFIDPVEWNSWCKDKRIFHKFILLTKVIK